MKRRLWGATAILAVLLGYLALAAVWASSVSSEISGQFPPLDRPLLTPAQTAILLKVDDPAYFAHYGIDLSSGKGLTTVTSSVARELYLNRLQLSGFESALQRFYQQVFACCKRIDIGRDIFALVLNQKLSKNQVLNLFVSTSYMGRNSGHAIWGLEEAAQSYFGAPVTALEQKQFVSLVAMLQSPNQFHPINNPAALAERVARIERLVQGRCQAQGLLDTHYPDCASAVD